MVLHRTAQSALSFSAAARCGQDRRRCGQNLLVRCPTKEESVDAIPMRQMKLTTIGQPIAHMIEASPFMENDACGAARVCGYPVSGDKSAQRMPQVVAAHRRQDAHGRPTSEASLRETWAIRRRNRIPSE